MNTTPAQAPCGVVVPGRGGNDLSPSFLLDPRAGVQVVVLGEESLSGVTTTDIGPQAVNLTGIGNGFVREGTQR